MTAAHEQMAGNVDGLAPEAPSAGPGARLRAAREAAGLSLDQVANQLKLAPRQVRALEEESFGELPGRTFSRGFVRNYARLLHLDAQDLLAHLPDVAQAPALESPILHSTGSLMAELPSTSTPRAGLGRWLIPLILIACIVAAAAYEWYRGGLITTGEAPLPASDATDRTVPATTPPGSAITLPNPLASASQPTLPVAGAAQDTAPQLPLPAASMRDSVAASASGSAATASAAPADAILVLTYQGPSWTEIRDRSGQLIVSRLVASGSVEPVKGTPPFEILLGNAHAVKLVFRGRSVDLSPYIRQNVARVTLQ